MRCGWMAGPTSLAIIVTLANAIKPVLIDDTAYLAYAHHIAEHPLDPYGFEIFWYTVPEPAMEVLAPPVVPYWLALGIRLLGEHPALLKLWLFPFVWLFARSLWELLRRFAKGTESVALPLIVLSPAVLPMVNLMLDIPALALGLASLVLLASGGRQPPVSFAGKTLFATAAGIAAGLAMQTKYTALLVPPLLLWFGLTHRSLRYATLAVSVSIIVFSGWEALVFAKYGRSHFLYHLSDQQQGTDFLRDKVALLAPLVGHLGCLAVGIGLYAGRAIGIPRGILAAFAILWTIGAATIAILPFDKTILIADPDSGHVRLALASVVWRISGAAISFPMLGCAVALLLRNKPNRRIRSNRDSIFVIGWVLLEVAGYFALTPFPAARRVIGVTIALGILAARTVSRMDRAKPERRPPHWILPFGIAVGFFVAALDTFDALPEKDLAKQAAEIIRTEAPTGQSWFVGHWGFQYYCERAGMIPVIPGESKLEAGDTLVLPLYPDDAFHRPYPGWVAIGLPKDAAEPLAVFDWDDSLSAQTIPNFYGGNVPIMGRDHPRLRVGVYRILRPLPASQFIRRLRHGE